MLTKQYLYNDFTTWMRDNGIDIKWFHGVNIVANRLGRVAEIAKKFNELKEYIAQFFNACVDANSNKLVLAASVYLECEGFQQLLRDLWGTGRFSDISTEAVAWNRWNI